MTDEITNENMHLHIKMLLGEVQEIKQKLENQYVGRIEFNLVKDQYEAKLAPLTKFMYIILTCLLTGIIGLALKAVL